MITQSELKHLVRYNKETGAFYYRRDIGRKVMAGKRAGCVSDTGYQVIKIKYIKYSARDLAILYVRGYMPEKRQVKSLSGLRHDCRYANLLVLKKNNNAEIKPVMPLRFVERREAPPFFDLDELPTPQPGFFNRFITWISTRY